MAGGWRVDDGDPRAGRHYPGTWPVFEDWFASETAARAYVQAVRFRDGVSCPRCGAVDGVRERANQTWWCPPCRRSFSLTSGTLLDHTKLELRLWLRAAWLVTNTKNGLSAASLEQSLGIGYHSAWHLLHKLRAAMDQRGRDKLRGVVEIDETVVGGPEPGHHGRSRASKQLVIIAVEQTGTQGFGRIRMARIYNESTVCVRTFIEDNIEPGSTLLTDGLKAYATAVADLAEDHGFHYDHKPTALSRVPGKAHEHLPGVHRVASLLKRWLLGTHQGAVESQHLDSYLDEFVFRFNRRHSRARGLLFWRLVCSLTDTDPTRRSDVTARAANLTEIDHETQRAIRTDAARRNREQARSYKATQRETADRSATTDPF